MNNITTITFDSNTNSTTDHPYFEMTDPDYWDGLAEALGKGFTESDFAKNKQLLFPVSTHYMPVVSIIRQKFWKFCKNVKYSMVPMSTGDIMMYMTFTPKKQADYNVEQLLNEVRHLRDQGLHFSRMPFTNPVTGDMDEVPMLRGTISTLQNEEGTTFRLAFLPLNTTLNGFAIPQDGNYEVTTNGPIFRGGLTEAV